MEVRRSFNVETAIPRLLKKPVENLPLLESRNPEMSNLLAAAERAATGDANILLTGESGTGKYVLARQIHSWSPRRERPFVAVNCATVTDQMLRRELLGQPRPAVVGTVNDHTKRLEAARNGTAFFYEVAELTSTLQALLLQFIQEQFLEAVDYSPPMGLGVRIIAASSRNIDAEVAAARFREDLYYRLNVITLELLPLRERIQDILPLARWMLKQARSGSRGKEFILSPEAAEALVDYRWPGNIRELRNALQCAVTLAHTNTIVLDDLPSSIYQAASGRLNTSGTGARLKEREREYIQRVLAETRTLDEAAMILGIDVTTLWRKRKRWGIK
jgi:two-component system, NtrC family, response regulator AlgB